MLIFKAAGRYLGELARITTLDFFTKELHIEVSSLPPQLTQRYGVTTAVVGKLLDIQVGNNKLLGSTDQEHPLVIACQQDIPALYDSVWRWDYERAMVLREITSRILQRATMLMASSIVGLMLCIGSLKSSKIFDALSLQVLQSQGEAVEEEVLPIGYTGGCKRLDSFLPSVSTNLRHFVGIMHFPHYLSGVQDRVNTILEQIRNPHSAQKIVFVPVNDGGIRKWYTLSKVSNLSNFV